MTQQTFNNNQSGLEVRTILNGNATDAESRLLALESAAIVLRTEQDILDNSTDSGGDRLMNADQAYFFSGIITSGFTLISNGTTIFKGADSAISGYNYTGVANALETSGGSQLSCDNIQVVAAAGSVIDDSVGQFVSFFQCALVQTSQSNLGSNIVSMSRNQLGNFTLPLSAGFLMSGTGNSLLEISANTVIPDTNAFTMFDLDTSTWRVIQFTDIAPNANPDNIILSGVASDGNLIPGLGVAVCNDVDFTGATTPLVGVSNKDIRWEFRGNPGLPDTTPVGCSNLTTPAPTVITVVSQFEKIAGTTMACPQISRWQQSADNELEYIGVEDEDVRIIVNISAERSGGAGNNDCEFSVFKDTGGGFVEVDANTRLFLELVANAKGGVILLRDTVSTGDKYTIYVKNDTDTDNVIVQTMQVDIEQ